jgi:1-aminocyclopropane-1-carboxylate deaminase
VTAAELLDRLARHPRVELACLPTPVHPLRRLSEDLGGPELWIKRDDLTGLAGGGNKTRKLEFVVGDALRAGAGTLVTVGAVQSNHTRQTGAAAARVGLQSALLHNNWVPAVGPEHGNVGNPLLSDLVGATLYHDPVERRVGDDGQLGALAEHLRAEGRRPYVIPGGASEHRLGSFGYICGAAEIASQERALGIRFDHVVHCTGSSSTQAGLLAGFAALGGGPRVVGVADDDETHAKAERVLRLASAALDELGLAAAVSAADVQVVASDPNRYGVAAPGTIDAIHRLAGAEGIAADPVYEGKALAGLIQLIDRGVLTSSDRVLLLHLGGTPAMHAYAGQLRRGELLELPFG